MMDDGILWDFEKHMEVERNKIYNGPYLIGDYINHWWASIWSTKESMGFFFG